MTAVCNNCGGTDIDKDPTRGHAACMGCGSVLEDTLIVSEVQFAENAGGGSSVIGQFVSSEGGGGGTSFTMGSGFRPGISKESRTLTLQNGKAKISDLAARLKLNQHSVETAFGFYKMAVSRGVTRGRRSLHVTAACLYLVCRTEGTPHMLLDFSDVLSINVYILGKTYLALARLLCINVPAIDPSLLIPRFAHKLEFGDKTHDVSMTAIRFVSRMKRDWMAMGRRPSGLCGAALLVASRVHNFCRTKKDIIKVVKVCESTLRKRLVEFEDTASGKLTIDEFQTIDLEEEADPPSFTQSRKEAKMKQIDDMIIDGVQNEITEISSEIDKELETRSSKQVANMEKEAASRLMASEIVGDTDLDDLNAASFLGKEIIDETVNSRASPMLTNKPMCAGQRPTAASLGLGGPVEQLEELPDDNASGELDLNGLDDNELEKFILTDEEMKKKEQLWMSLNGEFLKEQEEKAKRKAEEEAAKPPKVRRKRRKVNINASTAGEAMEKMLQEKKLSTKIDYEVLKNLTNGSTNDITNKLSQTASSTAVSNTISSTTQDNIDLVATIPTALPYLPDVVDETPSNSQVSVKRKRDRSKPIPLIRDTQTSTTKSSEPPQAVVDPPVSATPAAQAIVESEPIVESGPVQDEEDDIDEEHYEDDDEPISAAQLLGHGYTGEEEDYDYD
ncbi:transcription factor IIIB 90 kDa subunit-like [Watersipora subatra]|uniref:transcription factor IIIB 90 kDa subunit-like n=1 Tax=Watersipora subatra TaxID=2589382 RepID=UPI00355C3BC7